MTTINGAGLLGATYTPPEGAVRIQAGSNVQAAVDAYPAGTAFLLSAGTYSGQSIRPKSGDQFFGENGATVLDGNGAAKAFSGQGISNVTIAGLTITDYAPPSHGIGVLGTDAGSLDWQVLGNDFHGNSVGTTIMLGTRMVVRDNSIHDNWWTGIGGWNVDGAVIEHNEIARNNQSGQSPYTTIGDGGGIKIAQATGTRIADNYVHDNLAGPGIWTDSGSDLTLIEGNRVESNQAGGIFIELDYGSTVRNNVIIGNNNPFFENGKAGAIHVSNAQDAEIYGNTISGNGGAFFVWETARSDGEQGPRITEDVDIHDNTIVFDQGRNAISGTALDDPTIRFHDNDYWMSGTAAMYYGAPISVAEWQKHGYDTAASGSTFNTGSPPAQEPAPQQPAPQEPVPQEPVPQEPAPQQPASPADITLGTGPDTLVLKISQDAWEGSAQYIITVDGQQIGETLTAAAWHSAGQSDAVTIKGDWGAGTHAIAVTFLNDAWGGTAATDRNLYVDSITYNGAPVSGGSAALYTSAAQSFSFVDAEHQPGLTITGTSRSDVLVGTGGNDRITGGGGADTMTGAGGADDFLFQQKQGFDHITDFHSGEDRIVFEGITSSQVTTKVASYDGIPGLDIYYGSGAKHHVFLEGVSTLASGDLAFV